MENLNNCLNSYIAQDDVHNIAIRVGNRDEIFIDEYRYDKNPVDHSTLFDMASVTKILATTPLALIAIDNKLLSPDDYVSKFFDVPEDKKCMTVKNLLTHTMGIGYRYIGKEGNTYENIQDYILNIPSDVEIGTEFLYSCPGFILLGKIVEKVFGKRLNELFVEKVANPLGMKNSGYLPDKNNEFVNSGLTEDRIGVVNDNNCRFFGGVSGNAGLFSNIDDVCLYVKMLQNHGEPLMSREMFDIATSNHTPDFSESRGYGFIYVDEKCKYTGNLMPKGSIGHHGHTGQSVFVDPKSGFYCVLLSDINLSNLKKYGRTNEELTLQMRQDIHNAILADLADVKPWEI